MNGMENEKREALALDCFAAGALSLEAEPRIAWNNAAALEDGKLRSRLDSELAELIRDHYAAAQAVLGDPWAGDAARTLGLPLAADGLPERPLLVLGASADIPAWLPPLAALRRQGSSPAIAVIWNGREEDLRLSLDRADIRCHWLVDLESAAAAALQRGLLDFDGYCRILPQE